MMCSGFEQLCPLEVPVAVVNLRPMSKLYLCFDRNSGPSVRIQAMTTQQVPIAPEVNRG